MINIHRMVRSCLCRLEQIQDNQGHAKRLETKFSGNISADKDQIVLMLQGTERVEDGLDLTWPQQEIF